ncbi:DNA helicase [Aphelenchoides besseyi]|nr:DNA helicase [Aphelenchoides besseyi]
MSLTAQGKKRKQSSLPIVDMSYNHMFMNMVEVIYPADVSFYPDQKLMILKILNALKTDSNALIESPTGTGKTLALLSATCSYLLHYQKERTKSKHNCQRHGIQKTKSDVTEVPENNENTNTSASTETSLLGIDETTMDSIIFDGQTKADADEQTKEEELLPCTCLPKIRIYYCTRTHKQVSQVSHEFGRLPFAQLGVLHTILGSREQSCINKSVREQRGNLNENCIELNSNKHGNGCEYKSELKSHAQTSSGLRKLITEKVSKNWDLEELVKKVENMRSPMCPYFLTTRELTKDASLIFCPYNYLIDPTIRESSDVYLTNAIVILDEGHNIEDVSRESASFEISDYEIEMSKRSLEKTRSAIVDFHKNLNTDAQNLMLNLPAGNPDDEFLKRLSNAADAWYKVLFDAGRLVQGLASKAEQKPRHKFNQTRSFAMQSEELFTELSNVYAGWDRSYYNSMKVSDFRLLSGRDPAGFQNPNENVMKLMLRPISLAILCMEKWLTLYKFHSTDENKNFYKGFVEISPRQQMHVARDNGRTQHDPAPEPYVHGCTVKLAFWSMMPSMAFKDAFSKAKSVILASGTLSPIDGLSAELQTEFKFQHSGKQIIEKSRIFSTVLSAGPSSTPFNFTYNQINSNSAMMNDLGKVIVDVCRIVPKGILCFVSSYSFLDKLWNVMEQNGYLAQLKHTKKVFCEPRDGREMEHIMTSFEDAIFSPMNSINGAVIFGVYRGKVSEGMNFNDDLCRAVICVGIPYPNVMDQKVAQKKYFNSDSKNLSLLNGDQWYETAAFRALNQSLGRSCRHKLDWSAMLLIDKRLRNGKLSKISQWVRDEVRAEEKYENFCEALRSFVECRQAIDAQLASDDGEPKAKMTTASRSELFFHLNMIQYVYFFVTFLVLNAQL